MPVRWLYLLRHAKSSWEAPPGADIERPLAGRGRRDAKAMAWYLHEQGVVPALVLCSPARRARQTLKPLQKWLTETRVVIDEALYGAPADRLLRRVRDIEEEVASVMVIAHEPGTRELALLLAGGGHDAVRRRVEEKFPTAALAALAVPGADWGSLGPGGAELRWFVTPKDLGAGTGE